MELPPTLNVKQVAEHLGVSQRTAERRVLSGDIVSFKTGQLRRIRREALLAYIEQQEAAAK